MRPRMFRRRVPLELVGPKPLCFDQRQWDTWTAGELGSTYEPHPSGYCQVCTPQFQRRMCELNRCDHPLVEFRITAEGPEGMRPPNDQATVRWATREQIDETVARLDDLIDSVVEPRS